MRSLAVLSTILGLCLMGGAYAQEAGPAVGAKAPDFALRDSAGKSFRLSENVARQVTVLGFGRFSGQPCRMMLSELQKLYARYAGQGVGIYTVNLDGPSARRTAAASARELGVTFPVLLDPHSEAAKAYGVATVPHVVVIDASGIIRFANAGYQPELPAKLTEMIEQYRPAPKLPKLLVIQGAECVGCGPMPSILKEMKTALAGKLVVELHPYNADLVEQYQLESVPALLFFDAEGAEVMRHEGPMTKAEIVEQLQKMGVAVTAD